MTELSQTEVELILQSPVSPQRRNAFLEGFRADREKAATTEMLFRRANAFKEEAARPKPEDVTWSGFNVLLQKAPFTDLPNWGPYRSSQFAAAMEQHLLARLEQALRVAVEGRLGDSVIRDARPVIGALNAMAYELEQRGYLPTAFVLTGPLGTQLAVDMQNAIIGYWEPAVEQGLGTTFRIMGMHRGIPILDIPESPSPSVYAVDLGRFATLTRYGKEPQFKLEEIDTDRAKELLARNPNLVADPPPGSHNDAGRVRQLQLRVVLQLFETYQLSAVDKDAVVGSPLIGPVLEWQPEHTRQ